ncbi:unnamed protein product [Brassica oleracea]
MHFLTLVVLSFLLQVPRNISGLSHPLPACTATILMLSVSSVCLFDGFDWEMTNLHNISAYEAGHLHQGEPTTREAPSGANSKKPPAGAASKMAKKAWMA